jgi:outer membrane protein assembly factor BamB
MASACGIRPRHRSDPEPAPAIPRRSSTAAQSSSVEDNGKVIALRATDGGEMWEQQIATGEGRGEIERIQDVDGALAVDSGVVLCRRLSRPDRSSDRADGPPAVDARSLELSTGVALSASQVYVGDADSSIWALDLRTGSSEWEAGRPEIPLGR